ncbi:putative helicase mov-10-B.1 isoform X2 [Anopheles aquasalis]|uniref:putative helicase mov-10-B.1 isoform X2 n=1 Tax=Anopheles aquasalis TaxID=42839 RepID=UPI00215AEB2A|nr:putative helicase mov-10-B.1 isoform X2 [Anopheles aquasalis]
MHTPVIYDRSAKKPEVAVDNSEPKVPMTITTRCLHKWNGTTVKLTKSGTEIKVKQPVFAMRAEYTIGESILAMRVQNLCQQILLLRTIFLYYDNNRRVTFFNGIVRMVPGYEFAHEKKILFDSEKEYNIVLVVDILPNNVRLREISTIHFLKPRQARGPPLKIKKTQPFPVPEEVKMVYNNGFLRSLHYPRLASLWLNRFYDYQALGLNSSNYIDFLRMLNHIDDYDTQIAMEMYNIPNVSLIPTDFNNRYMLSIMQFPVPPVRLDVGDFVQAITPHVNHRCVPTQNLVRGFIAERDTWMTLQFENPLRIGNNITLKFPANRLPFLLEYRALFHLSHIDISSTLFPPETSGQHNSLPSKKKEMIESFSWFNTSIATNELQKTAIKNIVNRTAYPAPYILFGPPGTGKTSTIVEAVMQIYKNKPHSRVLVTATSNFACNELAKRLLEYVPVDDIYRYFPCVQERNIDLIDSSILEISNLHSGRFEFPSMEDFLKTRILVCTVMTSGRLFALGVKLETYDYIFIDECGSSKELSALVPIGIVGVDADLKKMHASVVLAGDPKQLGPVTFCSFLKQTPHDVSLLDRLMKMPLYARDPNNNNAYNDRMVTKLLDNYRSHYKLIAFSNREFYDGELRAKASPKTSHWAVGWERLKNPEFPMIFHAVIGFMQQDPFSLSYMNLDEAYCVYEYVQSIMKGSINDRIVNQEDIGIVTPYSRQVAFIKNGLSNLGLDNIEVGSTEQFQGREKSVIIISTVRSNRSTVGFLQDDRRLNVMLTRAKALTIIIGNPQNLATDQTWERLLKFIEQNNGFLGKNINLKNFHHKSKSKKQKR